MGKPKPVDPIEWIKQQAKPKSWFSRLSPGGKKLAESVRNEFRKPDGSFATVQASDVIRGLKKLLQTEHGATNLPNNEQIRRWLHSK